MRLQKAPFAVTGKKEGVEPVVPELSLVTGIPKGPQMLAKRSLDFQTMSRPERNGL